MHSGPQCAVRYTSSIAGGTWVWQFCWGSACVEKVVWQFCGGSAGMGKGCPVHDPLVSYMCVVVAWGLHGKGVVAAISNLIGYQD
jgi:hypothetical protein